MMNIWMLLSLTVTTCFMMFTSAQSDLYLDDHSGDYYDDDDNWTSGSGSGDITFSEDNEEMVKVRRVFLTSENEPSQDSRPDLSNTVEETFTFTDLSTETTQLETQVPEKSLDVSDETKTVSEHPPSTTSSDKTVSEGDYPYEVQSENLFQRKEVLAAVIAGGVIGFLFAIFLILLLVYRMRKKDEGSYDLGERKIPSSAYQKAPTKEFYA
ncbi:hypothetical protein DPEC_G00139310 [Dallia pectoralis]|uniref:Uncharacterized protein n=1 Tax=Dallia pectoralis TaxID=75939 RepID=A0ACC2GM69_DALPE|nr:hypothetical protein DPEC_G00139310 [Dallia pectoralis]